MRHPLTHGVKHGERSLRLSVALVGSLLIPLRGLGHIAFNAAAITISLGHVNFAADIALFRGLVVPGEGLPGVLGGLVTILGGTRRLRVFFAYRHLCGWITGVGLGQERGIDGNRLRLCRHGCQHCESRQEE